MRDILFRAKRADNGEWVEGIPIKTHIGMFICYDENPHYCRQYGYMEIDEIIMVDESTVCQYTGLTDKNGRKIFEGDIVRRKIVGDYIIGQVVWFDTGFCGFQLKCGNRYYPIGKSEQTGISGCDEVIGNIFDNSEMSGCGSTEQLSMGGSVEVACK